MATAEVILRSKRIWPNKPRSESDYAPVTASNTSRRKKNSVATVTLDPPL